MDMILKVREIGVSRIGASRTAEMLNECRQRLGMEPIAATAPGSGGY